MSEITGRMGGPRDELPPAEAVQLRPDASGGRWMRRHLSGGVAALTTVVDATFRATTISALTMVSIDPPQFLISLETDSQMEMWVRESRVFGLSFLTWHQQLLADRFAGFAPLVPARFDGIAHFTSVTGSPLLSDAIGWADCSLIEEFKTGDHTCLVGKVEQLGAGDGQAQEPLVYYRNRYRKVQWIGQGQPGP